MGRTSDSRSSTSRSDRRAGEALASAKTPAPDADLVEIARVLGAHGLRGQLRMAPHDAEAELPDEGERLVLVDRDGGAAEFEVRRVAPGRAGEWRVALAGLGDRDAAEALQGSRVHVEASCLAPLPEGEWYAYELVGCRLEGEDGRLLGRITSIWETGASDVLVVAGEEGREHLVPAALLRGVDTEARRAVVEVLPGLLGDE